MVPTIREEKLLLSIKRMKKKTVFHQTSNAVSACWQCIPALSRNCTSNKLQLMSSSGPRCSQAPNGTGVAKVHPDAKNTLSFLHALVSAMLMVSPGPASHWDGFPAAPCLPGLLILLPLSINISSKWPGSLRPFSRSLIFCVQIPQDFSADPGPRAQHIPLQRSHPQLGSYDSLFFPLHLLVFTHMLCSSHRHVRIQLFLQLHVPGNKFLPISTAKALKI